MKMESGLSVVVCTYNRSALLKRILHSLAGQRDVAPFEVIVVDNHSTDDTQQVLKEWKPVQTFRLITGYEETKGHYAKARNVGLHLASSEIVAFVDDDVRVPPHWAAHLLAVFAAVPDIGAVGGPVTPEWEQDPPPEWVTPELFVCIGVGDYGSEARLLSRKEFPIGANMAFKADVLRSVGGFDPRFGIIGDYSIYNDEVELVERLRRKGVKVYYDPRLEVFHLVAAARTNKKYFLKRRSIDGRSIALVESLHRGKWFVLRNIFIRAALAIGRDGTAYVGASLLRRNTRFVYSCRLAKTRKYISTAFDILRGRTAFFQPT